MNPKPPSEPDRPPSRFLSRLKEHAPHLPPEAQASYAEQANRELSRLLAQGVRFAEAQEVALAHLDESAGLTSRSSPPPPDYLHQPPRRPPRKK